MNKANDIVAIPMTSVPNSNSQKTTFQEVYDFFLAGITDDMFMELTREDTEECLEEILLAAIPQFEFPRKNLFDVDLKAKRFNCKLDLEELMILRQYMIAEWLSYQLASVDNVRQKYSGLTFWPLLSAMAR